MEQATRRTFMMHVALGSSALVAGNAMAQAAAVKLDEKDAQAVALAYAADTTKVDQKKYPKHTAEQKCTSCQLYTGKAKEALGPCSLFPGKQVAANGWCSAWVKKAA